MENKESLLSICIPTYNGATSFLKEVIQQCISLAELFPNEVEVIVSDNASSDKTPEIISSFTHHSCFRAYRNEENRGFNGNLKLLIDEYAKGKYSWVVGDDDFIIASSFPYIIDTLRSGQYKYISLGSGIINESDLAKTLRAELDFNGGACSYAKAIDTNCYNGNILSTFMGASIFLTSDFKSFPKDFLVNAFDDYKVVFPNGYIMASVFYDSPCYCIPQKAIVSVSHKKGWSTSDNLYAIYTQYLPSLYNLLISKRVNKNELKNTKRVLMYEASMITLVRIREKLPIKDSFKLFLKVLMCPSVILRISREASAHFFSSNETD